jgi:hypothetical protein
MSVRCKFKVTAIKRTIGSQKKRDAEGNLVRTEKGYDVYEPCEMATIEMSPVYANNDPGHENSKFWDASPGGKFELNCVNKAAVEQLELDKEYYIDITPA